MSNEWECIILFITKKTGYILNTSIIRFHRLIGLGIFLQGKLPGALPGSF
jgi:hypothetical protein